MILLGSLWANNHFQLINPPSIAASKSAEVSIVLPKRFMLVLRVLKCLDDFQSILMNTTLADISVLCSSGTSGLCSVAAIIQGQCLAAAIWVAEGMQVMEARQC